jgi:dihydrofolate reductase
MSKISIIVAATQDLVIGNDNTLPWHLPTDLKFFKKTTEGHFVIMGRKCWESIPDKFRPLSNRHNIVISRNLEYECDATVINDLDTILKVFKNDGENAEVFVIGGSKIYKEAFKYADKLYLTQIMNKIEGDVVLEGLDFREWYLIETSEMMVENDINFRFTTFERRDYE